MAAQEINVEQEVVQKDRLLRVENILLVSAVLVSYLASLSDALNGEESRGIGPVAQLLAGFALVYWLYQDIRRRRIKPWMDYGFFAYVAWGIVFPYYLFHTRRWKGLVTIAWFLAMHALGMVIYYGIYMWLYYRQ